MNAYDQAVRFTVKADPAGFVRWLVPGLPPTLEFRGWLDARTLPFPGEPDRTCDTVAELFDPADPSIRWALATEFQAEPDPDILDRLLEYLARLRRELRHGPKRRDKFRVAAGLVHLTGPPSADLLDMTLPGESAVGLRLTIASKALRNEDAAATLAEIAEGRASQWLLPWIPLMKGGGKPTMMEEWKRLAIAEPDPRSRANFASLALIFAELTRHLDRWKQTLEGWNMKESIVVNEWKAEALQDALLRILRSRFPSSLPKNLEAAVEAEFDLARLNRGLDALWKSASIEEFRSLTGL
jgi:hypothetical protein